MKMSRSILGRVLMLTLLFVSLPSSAEQGNWLVRLRGIAVLPQDDSGLISANNVPVPGSGVAVDDSAVPELDVTYMFHRNWGVEVIAGTAQHTVTLDGPFGPLPSGFKVFDAWVLPPTVTLQYHFLPEGNIRPYVGMGVNYTTFLGENASSAIESVGLGPATVGMTSSWGFAAQAGVDISIKDNWFVNIDVKYIDIDSTASVMFKNAGVRLTVDANIDPIVFGAGIGYRF
jgi:outer membrane protein